MKVMVEDGLTSLLGGGPRRPRLMSCRSLGRYHLLFWWWPLLRRMVLAQGLWGDSLRADSADSNGLSPVALVLPVCMLGCHMSCHGLKCATFEL